MAPWLSMLSVVGPEYGILSSPVRVHCQMTCHMARLSAMYLASIDNNSTIGCFFNCHVCHLENIARNRFLIIHIGAPISIQVSQGCYDFSLFLITGL